MPIYSLLSYVQASLFWFSVGLFSFDSNNFVGSYFQTEKIDKNCRLGNLVLSDLPPESFMIYCIRIYVL